MHTKTTTVTHQAWFLFAPVWFEEDPATSEIPCPIPRWGLWWVFEAAWKTQEFLNFLFCLFGLEDAAGFTIIFPKEMRKPREVSYATEVE